MNDFRKKMTELGLPSQVVYRPGDRKIGGQHNQAWLRKAYFDDEKTIQQIAVERGCSEAAVARALRKFDDYKQVVYQRRRKSGGKKKHGARKKLSNRQVLAARKQKRTTRIAFKILAAKSGVCVSTIRCAVVGITFKYLNAIEAPVITGCHAPFKLYYAETLEWMNRSQNMSAKEIASELGTTDRHIKDALKGKGIRRKQYHFSHRDGRIFEGTFIELKAYDKLVRGHLGAMVSGDRPTANGWTLTERLNDPDFAFGQRKGKRHLKTNHTKHHWVHKDGRTLHGSTIELLDYAPEMRTKQHHSNLLNLIRVRKPRSVAGWTICEIALDPSFTFGRGRKGAFNNRADPNKYHWRHKDGHHLFGTMIDLFAFDPTLQKKHGMGNIYSVKAGMIKSAYGWSVSRAVVTPDGRFESVALAAEQCCLTWQAAGDRARKNIYGWRYELNPE